MTLLRFGVSSTLGHLLALSEYLLPELYVPDEVAPLLHRRLCNVEAILDLTPQH